MPRMTLRRPWPAPDLLFALFVTVLVSLALAPATARAQAADSTNTLPTGIYENSGRFKVAPAPIVLIGKDSNTGSPCILGFDPTCLLALTLGASGLPDTAAGDLAAMRADLDAGNTPALFLPPEPVQPAADTTLTPDHKEFTASGDNVLISATSAQSSRVHRIFCTLIPTSGSVVLTIKDGSTTLSTLTIPSVGMVLDRPFSSYWYYKTSNNTALNFNFSAGGDYRCTFAYVKGA